MENHIIALVVIFLVLLVMDHFYQNHQQQIVKNVTMKMVIIIILMMKELVLVLKQRNIGKKFMVMLYIQIKLRKIIKNYGGGDFVMIIVQVVQDQVMIQIINVILVKKIQDYISIVIKQLVMEFQELVIQIVQIMDSS